MRKKGNKKTVKVKSKFVCVICKKKVNDFNANGKCKECKKDGSFDYLLNANMQ